MFPTVLAAVVGLLVFAANSISIYHDFKVVRTSRYSFVARIIVAEFKSNLNTAC
jgi:hypothetical protein